MFMDGCTFLRPLLEAIIVKDDPLEICGLLWVVLYLFSDKMSGCFLYCK